MKFVITLPEDGRQIACDIHVPGSIPAGPQARSALVRLEKTLRARNPAAPVRQRIADLIPVIAAQLEAHLPPEAPPHFEIQRDANDRIVRAVPRKATPAPATRATEIARQLAPHVAVEQLVALEVVTDVSRQANKLERRIEAAIRD